MDDYKVYVQTDETGRITAINSSAFVANPTDWQQIDQGEGDRCHHAQGHYLPLPLITAEGVYRYKLVGGAAMERTAAELAADTAAIPGQPPTPEQRLQAQIDAITIAVLEGGAHAQ